MKKPILVDLILFSLFLKQKQFRLGASTVFRSKLFHLAPSKIVFPRSCSDSRNIKIISFTTHCKFVVANCFCCCGKLLISTFVYAACNEMSGRSSERALFYICIRHAAATYGIGHRTETTAHVACCVNVDFLIFCPYGRAHICSIYTTRKPTFV